MVDLNELRKILRDESMKFEEPEPVDAGGRDCFDLATPVLSNGLCIRFTLSMKPEINMSAKWEHDHRTSLRTREALNRYRRVGEILTCGTGPLVETFLEKYQDLERERKRAHASLVLWRMGEPIDGHIYTGYRSGENVRLGIASLRTLAQEEVWKVPRFALVEFKGFLDKDSPGSASRSVTARMDRDRICKTLFSIVEWYKAIDERHGECDG